MIHIFTPDVVSSFSGPEAACRACLTPVALSGMPAELVARSLPKGLGDDDDTEGDKADERRVRERVRQRLMGRTQELD